MRKYRAVLPESIAREKAWKKELERRKAATKARKKKEAEKRKRERAKEREKLKKLKAKEKEKERLARKKERQRISAENKAARYKKLLEDRKLQRQKYKEEHKEELSEKKRIKDAEREEKMLLKCAEKSIEDIQHQMEAEKAKKALEREKEKKKRRKERNHRYYAKKRAKELLSRRNRRYYESHHGLEVLKKHIETNDIPGKFMIAIAQDNKIQSAKYRKHWWNEAIEKYNEMVEENHSAMLCPVDEIASSKKVTKGTVMELLLLKRINPEVEDNISVFRDKYGRAVTIKTDDEKWTIACKEPWYVEEKFIVPNLNPVSGKKDAKWICENFIENDLSVGNMKKVFLWGNYVIIDGDQGFEFAIGKTVNAAINLYMALFKKYENAEYVIFIGELDPSLVSKWTEKIKEKTGWKNLKRGKHTYYTKGVPSKGEAMAKSIPTSSRSIKSVSGNSSDKR